MTYSDDQLREGRRYKVQGKLKDAMLCRKREYLVAGAAGTGKSLMILNKLYLIACKYPGCRILIIRKTRHSMTTSTLVTFENEVVPFGSPIIGTMQRKNRQEYNLPNGSCIVVGGMDNPEKILSSQYDIIYYQEATEGTEDDWEMAMSRLRNGVVPYQQIIGDCNPSYPAHWIKRRCDIGKCEYFYSTHEDNPVLYDERRGDWTERGREYLSVLDTFTGARLQRLRFGKWAMPEGARWPQFNRQEHCFDAWRIWHGGVPEGWKKWVSVDYGTKDPYCALWHTIDPTGRNIYTYREDYEKGYFADEQGRRIIEMSPKNENYGVVRMDPNMWTPFPRHEAGATKKSAHELIASVLKKDRRFGRIEKGFNKSRMHGFMFIDSILDRQAESTPNWWISYSCPKLIEEIEGATYKKVGQIYVEDDIDGDDHAITSSIYGLYSDYRIREEESDEIDYEKIAKQKAEARKKDHDERFRKYAATINSSGRYSLGNYRRR